ncbi:hypothetical protein DFH09DRAFT_1170382, partial [Mycena vulgaris]
VSSPFACAARVRRPRVGMVEMEGRRRRIARTRALASPPHPRRLRGRAYCFPRPSRRSIAHAHERHTRRRARRRASALAAQAMAPRESSWSEIKGGTGALVRARWEHEWRRAGSVGGEKETSVKRGTSVEMGTLRSLFVKRGALRSPSTGSAFWRALRMRWVDARACLSLRTPEETRPRRGMRVRARRRRRRHAQLVPVDQRYSCPRIHSTSYTLTARDTRRRSIFLRPLPHQRHLFLRLIHIRELDASTLPPPPIKRGRGLGGGGARWSGGTRAFFAERELGETAREQRGAS